MNVRYEAVFGDQSLFKCAKDDIVAIRHIPGDFKSTLHCTKEQLDGLDQSDFIHYPMVSMRRIIKTPQWTWEDKKAGRLPDIGAKYIGKNELNPETELICDFVDGDKCVWGHDKNKKMFCFYAYSIKPIETPEEKANRLREEFVESVMKNIDVNDENLTSICDIELGARMAYDEMQRRNKDDKPA